jgi:hypothetical protein
VFFGLVIVALNLLAWLWRRVRHEMHRRHARTIGVDWHGRADLMPISTRRGVLLDPVVAESLEGARRLWDPTERTNAIMRGWLSVDRDQLRWEQARGNLFTRGRAHPLVIQRRDILGIDRRRTLAPMRRARFIVITTRGTFELIVHDPRGVDTMLAPS